MKKTTSLLALILAFLSSCQDSAKDNPFTVGNFDEFDYHFEYGIPILMSDAREYSIDLDQDGTKDIIFRYLVDQGSNYLISSIYVEQKGGASGIWEFASEPFTDSIFMCKDANSSSRTIYNTGSGYSCTLDTDSLMTVLTLAEMALQCEEDASVENYIAYDQLVNFHRFETVGPPEAREFFYDYYPGGEPSYIVLRRSYLETFQYAWIKVKLIRDPMDKANADLEILEYAIQSFGRE